MTRPPYSQEISRQNKACFLFLLDQSFSMEEPLGSSALRKCDELAKVLFAMSSVLPEPFVRHATQEGFRLQPGARGMAFNADMVCLIQFLNMGTRAAPGLR